MRQRKIAQEKADQAEAKEDEEEKSKSKSKKRANDSVKPKEGAEKFSNPDY